MCPQTKSLSIFRAPSPKPFNFWTLSSAETFELKWTTRQYLFLLFYNIVIYSDNFNYLFHTIFKIIINKQTNILQTMKAYVCTCNVLKCSLLHLIRSEILFLSLAAFPRFTVVFSRESSWSRRQRCDTGIRQMSTSFIGLAGLTLLIARLDPCPCVPENVNQHKLKWDKVRLKSSRCVEIYTRG